MRWYKRSTRDEILKGISFGKRGEVGSGDKDKDIKAKGRKALIWGVVFFILLSLVVVGYAYFSSEDGQRVTENIRQTVSTFTADFIGDYFGGLTALGSGDYFNYKVNASSKIKGIVLTDFKAIGASRVPAGKDFDLKYDIDFVNVDDSDSYFGNYYCYFNTSKDDVPPNEQRLGTIIPKDIISIRKGQTVTCRIPGEMTEDLDGAYTFYGSLDFETETIDATLPVYFITGDVADELDGRDFFDAYGLDINQGDLQVTYNGEPIAVGIGVDGDQPVIVRTGDVKSYNTVGITLTNEWGGDIVELTNMVLVLPEEVTLDEELNGEPSLSCPFVYSAGERGYNEYVMDENVRLELFDNYIANNEFFGDENYYSFQCWIKVDESIFGDSPYTEEEYSIDLQYRYKVPNKGAVVSIIGTGQELIQ